MFALNSPTRGCTLFLVHYSTQQNSKIFVYRALNIVVVLYHFLFSSLLFSHSTSLPIALFLWKVCPFYLYFRWCKYFFFLHRCIFCRGLTTFFYLRNTSKRMKNSVSRSLLTSLHLFLCVFRTLFLYDFKYLFYYLSLYLSIFSSLHLLQRRYHGKYITSMCITIRMPFSNRDSNNIFSFSYLIKLYLRALMFLSRFSIVFFWR